MRARRSEERRSIGLLMPFDESGGIKAIFSRRQR
jgi:hypothetical protein